MLANISQVKEVILILVTVLKAKLLRQTFQMYCFENREVENINKMLSTILLNTRSKIP